MKLALITLALLALACSPAAYHGLRGQQASWVDALASAALAAEAERLQRCPALARGCFVSPGTCLVTVCFCPRVCGYRTPRIWRQTAGACLC